MSARSSPITRWSVVAVLGAAPLASVVLGGCRTMEAPTPMPVRTDDMGRTIRSVAPDRSFGFVVETGVLAGPLPGSSERLAAGLRVAIRAEAGLPGTAASHGVEESRPSALPVATVRWPRGALGFESGAPGPTDDVVVEWMVGLTARGSCAVEVELVPRLTSTCSAPAFLESFRIRRTVAVGGAIVLAADPTAGSSSDASLLVGPAPGRPGRFVIRVR